MGVHVNEGDRILDVGSADGPSAQWLYEHGNVTSMDVDPRGLPPGGVVGSAMDMPFADNSFDIVSAFDVIEHCSDEELAFREIERVLKPGGLLLMSVPAYEWAWTAFDDQNAHYRRYTRPRLRRGLQNAKLQPVRITYAFAGVFPFFTAARLATRMKERGRRGSWQESQVPILPHVSSGLSSFFERLCRLDESVLRSQDLPFGSSVLGVARKAV